MHNPLRNGLNIETVFRWKPPKEVNWPLLGYKISCWYEKDNSRYDLFIEYHLQPEINEKYMENLPRNANLYCKVKAETIAGEGSYSSLVSMSTLFEKTIPRVFAESKYLIVASTSIAQILPPSVIFVFIIIVKSVLLGEINKFNLFCGFDFKKK